ncbi:Arginyl-tRNA synthetase, partial [Mortierella alpina]
ICNTKERWGCNKLGQQKKVIVEFSSLSIAKPFHAGYLRSTIIASFVRNILDATGYDILSINYLGDWIKQYGLLAVEFERYGSDEKLLEDPIKHLFDVYVKINMVKDTPPRHLIQDLANSAGAASRRPVIKRIAQSCAKGEGAFVKPTQVIAGSELLTILREHLDDQNARDKDTQ